MAFLLPTEYKWPLIGHEWAEPNPECSPKYLYLFSSFWPWDCILNMAFTFKSNTVLLFIKYFYKSYMLPIFYKFKPQWWLMMLSHFSSPSLHFWSIPKVRIFSVLDISISILAIFQPFLQGAWCGINSHKSIVEWINNPARVRSCCELINPSVPLGGAGWHVVCLEVL